MTTIKIFKANNQINGFEASGHTGYAEQGSDILCASVSSLIGACHLGLKKVLGLNPSYEINHETGFFKLWLSRPDAQNPSAQVLLQTLAQSLEELALNNKKFIKLQIKGE